jgi:hypothetical protein
MCRYVYDLPAEFHMRFIGYCHQTEIHTYMVVSLTRRPPFYSEEDSWYPFLLEAESTQGA